MTAKEFTFYLRGYLKALKPDANITEVIKHIEEVLDTVDKEELPKADKQAEDIFGKWIEKNPSPMTPNPICPTPYPVVMYGCQTGTYIQPDSIVTSSTYTINKNKDNE